MFLKVLVSIFSILVFIKNVLYSVYEYRTNENIVGALSVAATSFFSVVVLNIVLFFIKY